VPVPRGRRVRISTIEGRQVADTWALGAPDTGEWLSMEHTRGVTQRLTPRVGDDLVTNRRRPLLRLVEDTSPGVHDTLIPACDPQRYADLGHRGFHRSCADNFAAVVAESGWGPHPVPSPFNLFMSVSISGSGDLALGPSPAGPGDSVVLEALRDALVVVSACPQDLVPINGTSMRPTPVGLTGPF